MDGGTTSRKVDPENSGSRWNFDDIFHCFRDITTSGWLAAILDFRHQVTSAMTAGHLDLSYIVKNPCIVFGMTCVSVNPAKLLVLPVSAAILDFWRTSMSHETGSTIIGKLDPENIGEAAEILSLCALELEVCLGVFYPPPCCRQTSQKTVAGGRVKLNQR